MHVLEIIPNLYGFVSFYVLRFLLSKKNNVLRF